LYGPLLLLHHLAEEVGLREHLGTYAGEILSMVYAHCLDYQSVSQAVLAPGEPTRNFLTGIVTHPAYQSDEAGEEKMD
jgi:Transposase DDE domain